MKETGRNFKIHSVKYNDILLISIIVAIYNVEKQLNRCIDSIISQSGDDIEIILVDDASPDGCGKICDDYARLDDRIRVIHHEKNGGLSVARNTGIENAVGKWIVFVDGDDTLTPDAVEIMRGYAEIEADMILFGHNTVDRYGKLHEFKQMYGEGYINTPEALYGYKISTLKCRKNELYSNFSLQTMWSKMWNREFLNKYNLRAYKGIKKGQDAVFTFLCAHYFSRIYATQKSIYNYTHNNEAITKRYSLDIAKMNNSIINAVIDIIHAHDETKDKEIMDGLYSLCVYCVHVSMELGIYHRDCHCNKKQRIKWLEELCSYEWVQLSAGYLERSDNVKSWEIKIIKAIINRDYRELDSIGRKMQSKERIKEGIRRNKLCNRFIPVVKRIIKKE